MTPAYTRAYVPAHMSRPVCPGLIRSGKPIFTLSLNPFRRECCYGAFKAKKSGRSNVNSEASGAKMHNLRAAPVFWPL